MSIVDLNLDESRKHFVVIVWLFSAKYSWQTVSDVGC